MRTLNQLFTKIQALEERIGAIVTPGRRIVFYKPGGDPSELYVDNALTKRLEPEQIHDSAVVVLLPSNGRV